MLRTHSCGELNKSCIGGEVILAGWVVSRRDHGGLIFVDVRDRYGITQVVFNPDNKELHNIAQDLRSEFVIQVKGKVRQRPQGTENKKISTGEIEVVAEEINILNTSSPPIFEINKDASLSEDVRYKYRYLDLRRTNMQKNMILRHKVCKIMRDYFDKRGFIEIETPILTKSTPEGARDYLVPSRLNPGQFYALPQSPQLFKQILMISGLDRYFQIAKCFRDEDLRADRQPEFTQLDIEMSFVEEKDIFSLIEGLFHKIFKEVIGYELQIPFDIMKYPEAIARFGCDKPDRRYGMELVDLSDEFKGCGFDIFESALLGGGIVKGLNLKNPKEMPRSRIDRLMEFVKSQGASGITYFKVEGGRLSGPIVKFFSDNKKEMILKRMQAEKGDFLLFLAGEEKITNEVLARLRAKLAAEDGLIKRGVFDFLWIVDFPLFSYSSEEKRWESEHHPFTAPFEEDIRYLETDLSKIRARSYDLVVNGVEIASGSIRIHRTDIQEKIFRVLGIAKMEAEERFGFLTEALSFGAPPHGGIAPGLDRLVAILAGCDSIREVIAFPKTQKAICPMTNAPSPVSKKQLDELGLEIKEGPVSQ